MSSHRLIASSQYFDGLIANEGFSRCRVPLGSAKSLAKESEGIRASIARPSHLRSHHYFDI
jgi:hypothetical protein